MKFLNSKISILFGLVFFQLFPIKGFAEESVDKSLVRVEYKINQIESQILGNRERLIRLEAKLEGAFKGEDYRLNAIGQRISDLNNLMYVVIGAIIALIGFVIWDRRSAVSPVAKKNKELELREDLLEKALKEYAKREPKFAEVLRSVGLL